MISGLLVVMDDPRLWHAAGVSPTVVGRVGMQIGLAYAVLTHNDELARFATIGRLVATCLSVPDVFLYNFLPL